MARTQSQSVVCVESLELNLRKCRIQTRVRVLSRRLSLDIIVSIPIHESDSHRPSVVNDVRTDQIFRYISRPHEAVHAVLQPVKDRAQVLE